MYKKRNCLYERSMYSYFFFKFVPTNEPQLLCVVPIQFFFSFPNSCLSSFSILRYHFYLPIWIINFFTYLLHHFHATFPQPFSLFALLFPASDRHFFTAVFCNITITYPHFLHSLSNIIILHKSY